jgi:hypothetical protein
MGEHPPDATTKAPEAAGFLRRVLTTIAGVLKRGVPGKSGRGYMQQFSGDNEYWDRVIAAQRGWPANGVAGKASARSVKAAKP